MKIPKSSNLRYEMRKICEQSQFEKNKNSTVLANMRDVIQTRISIIHPSIGVTSICSSVFLSPCSYVCVCICLSVCLCVCLSVCMFRCPSVYPFVCLFQFLNFWILSVPLHILPLDSVYMRKEFARFSVFHPDKQTHME